MRAERPAFKTLKDTSRLGLIDKGELNKIKLKLKLKLTQIKRAGQVWLRRGGERKRLDLLVRPLQSGDPESKVVYYQT